MTQAKTDTIALDARSIIPKIEPANIEATANRYLPDNKYFYNRLLLIAGLAQGNTTLNSMSSTPYSNALSLNEDIETVINALNQLNILVEKKDCHMIVKGSGGKFPNKPTNINVGDNGTFARFATSLASLTDGKEHAITLKPSVQMAKRPMEDLFNALRALGATVQEDDKQEDDKKGYLPATIHGPLVGGECYLNGNISSQYLSSLLIVLPFAQTDSVIHIEGELISKPYIDMTLSIMKTFGYTGASHHHYSRFTIVKATTPYTAPAKPVTLPPDVMSYSYVLAWRIVAAFITTYRKDPSKKNLSAFPFVSDYANTLTNFHEKLFQGERELPFLLQKMQCITLKPNRVQEQKHHFLGLGEVDMGDKPDLVPTLAVLAALAQTSSLFTNIAHLKYKESNRIAQCKNGLHQLGFTCEHGDDYLKIVGLNKSIKNQHAEAPITIDAASDHRIAMSFAPLVLLTGRLTITHKNCVNKSFPKYWQFVEALGVSIN